MKYKFFILLLAFVLLSTGCSNENKCIESHEETKSCVSYIYIPTANGGIQMIPVVRSCKIEVCDIYESEVTNGKY